VSSTVKDLVVGSGLRFEDRGIHATGNPLGNPVLATGSAGMPLVGPRTRRDLRRCAQGSPAGRVVSYF
jgi:hypothetical protein